MKLPSQTTESDISRRILWAAFIVGAATMVAKLGATAKELIVARWFGRGDALDAFLIAFLLPSFVLNLVMGAFAGALVPTFIRVRENQGQAAAQKLFSSIMFLTALGLLAITLLLGLLAPYYLHVLGSSFSQEKLRLTRHLLYTLLPIVLINGLATCASAVLNAAEKFALPALTLLVTPLITILFLEFGPVRWGAFLLATSLVAGAILEAAIVFSALGRQGIRPEFRWHGLVPETETVLRQWMPLMAASLLTGTIVVVDQSMAAMLSNGSVAALNYANKVISVIVAIGGSAVSTATLPYFSRMVVQNDWVGCRHTLRRYSCLIVAGTVPVVLCLMAFSRPLVRLLFQRGAFTAADTDLVSWVQACYAVQIPFYLLSSLFSKFLCSMKLNRVLLICSGVNLALDIVLNLVLMRIWGVAGIAMSTSLFFAVSFVVLGTYSARLIARESLPTLAPAPEQSVIR